MVKLHTLLEVSMKMMRTMMQRMSAIPAQGK